MNEFQTGLASLRLRALGMALGFAACVLEVGSPARAQEPSLRPSDLARQNADRVAASAAELKSFFSRDTSLMIALKHWVAKDASDHGQIVNDADLGDEAIFARLETDLTFRAAATRLLQRYGYLIPRLNPGSDQAREREMVLAKRSRLLSERQAETLTGGTESGTGMSERRAGGGMISCGNEMVEECNSEQVAPNLREEDVRRVPGAEPDLEQRPQNSSPFSAPESREPRLLRTQAGDSIEWMQSDWTESDWTEDEPILPPLTSSSHNPKPFPANISANRGESAESLDGRWLGSRSPQDLAPPPSLQSAKPRSDGLLASYGTGLGTEMLAEFTGTSLTKGGRPIGIVDSQRVPAPNPREIFRPQPAEIIRMRSPYEAIPSLYDMYVQAVAHPEEPRRFGMEVFENGTRDSQRFPMDLPAGPDYVVGPGDGLSFDLWGSISQRLYRVIDREGRVSLPEVGPIPVSGKTLAAIQEDVQRVLRTQFREVSADVSLARLRTVRVYEVGDVVKPGAYDVSSLSTPLNALFAAGGPTPTGSLRIINHYRGNQLIETVDVYDLLLHGVKSNLLRLENGDSVQVPPIGPRVTVEGMVRRPAIYELKDEKCLSDVFELAGGILPVATLRHIEVQRLEAHEKQTMLSLDIPEGDAPRDVTNKLDSFPIQDGDRIRIFPIAPYNEGAIYLEGHVVRPGRYSYRAGMRVTDLVASYKDLLPEPAARYAEIIRLHAPDFHPVVESFDLAAALKDPSDAPALQAMDTVRIFSRFDFENPPTVSVLGEVRTPGTFQTSGVVRLADAVHLAGGIAPDAETGDAQVFRNLTDGRFKIFSVNLGEALAGDPASNILLEPRDRLLIHRSLAVVEPATVYIHGEIARPGRYPLTTNMRLADLVRVGGGMKPGADPQTADLTRYDWTNPSKVLGEHETVALPAALSGETGANIALRNGDVLTIRELPGWEDLGASIVVRGEVNHAGTYGIRPGERLSSVLGRAGGFSPDAYAYGAILQRTQVREMEAKARDEMVLRMKAAEDDIHLLPDSDPKQKLAKELALEQWQSSMAALNANPPAGRVTVRISSEINHWKNTSADIEVRAGDILLVPKKPSSVMVTGQVFNPTAVSYRPGKNARWYLGQSGGPTAQANRRAIFVVGADGSVMGAKNGPWLTDALDSELRPGDTVVVPEKALGAGPQWSNLLLSAQAASSIASAVFIALHY